jgi:hypothetical protein
MTKMRVPVFLLLCWGCLGLPNYESYAFVHRTAPLQWFSALHGCTALALGMVAAYTIYERLQQSGARRFLLPVGLIVVAGLDVGMQWYLGSDYLLTSLLQPFHVLAIALLIWRMTTIADNPTASYGEALLSHGAALIGVWGVAATWSPLVVVYADQYSGGDTLVGHGVTCLLVFVASLVLTARRTIDIYRPSSGQHQTRHKYQQARHTVPDQCVAPTILICVDHYQWRPRRSHAPHPNQCSPVAEQCFAIRCCRVVCNCRHAPYQQGDCQDMKGLQQTSQQIV